MRSRKSLSKVVYWSVVGVLLVGVSGAILLTSLPVRADSYDGDIYAVKYLCGIMKEQQEESRPVKLGNYATNINIFNPLEDGVSFYWKVVLVFPEHRVTEYEEGKIEPNQAVDIWCKDIRRRLDEVNYGHAEFVKGFVVLEFPEYYPLEVCAVYTVSPSFDEGVTSIDVEKVYPIYWRR